MKQADKYLSIYLNDHLAGATAGVEAFKRVTRWQSTSQRSATLSALTREVEEDRMALLDTMKVLGAPVDRLKVTAGWSAEKLGRLKLNGHVLDRSPLSDVVELEALGTAVEGKRRGWRVLANLARVDSRLDTDLFESLIERAESQAARLEQLRLEAAAIVFEDGP